MKRNCSEFTFLLDQKIKRNYTGGMIEMQIMALSIIKCFDRFVPEKFILYNPRK